MSDLEQKLSDSLAAKALEKALHGEKLDFNDGLVLMSDDKLPLICSVADIIRRRVVGEDVSFVVSYNMNYSNVCAASCQICAFYRRKEDADAYTFSKEEILDQVSEGVSWGATEVHIVGGLNPYLGIEYYEEMFEAIKAKFPDIIIKALTMAEIFFIAKLTKNSVNETLQRLKASGLGALPGGGAEIFHDEIRPLIARGKMSGDEWLQTAEQAHRLGIRSNSTMLYDHIENDKHRVDHILKLRDLQEKTGGFISFIPLKFSPPNTELLDKGSLSNNTSPMIDLRVMAVSRLLLGDYIKNIVVYWVPLGKDIAQNCLTAGGNDLMGTSFREKIYKEAGRDEIATKDDLANMVREIGRKPVERDTFYNVLKRL